MSECVLGVCACVNQNTQHEEMDDLGGRVAGQSMCAFSRWGNTIRDTVCVVSGLVCVFWGRVSVYNQGKACTWLCVCSLLHLGEDMYAYMCDSLSVYDQSEET